MPIPPAQPPGQPPPGKNPGPTLTKPTLTPVKVPTPAASGPEQFDPIALVLACVLPGLGHWYLGEKKRAGLIATGVLGLFLGGMLIGGIDVVDSKEDTIWFVGEALVGPLAFGADYYHQNFLKVHVQGPQGPMTRSANPGEIRNPNGTPGVAAPGQNPPNTKSLGRMNELGTLFSTIAGMMNLIVIIDAAVHRKK